MKIALVGAVILGVAGLPVLSHYRAKWRLLAYKNELRSNGERLTLAEVRPALSADEINAGAELLIAASRLASSYSNAPMMKFIGPGRALAACGESVLPTDESTNIWPAVVLLFEQNEAAVDRLRAAVSASTFGFDLDYKAGPNLLLPHLSRMKASAQWLSLAAMVELHTGEVTNGWEDVDALAALVAGYDKDALIIGELVRLAIAAIAINTTWEALQCSGCTEDQLRVVQARWKSVDFLKQAESALAVERISGEITFAAGRESFTAVNFQSRGSSTGLSELAQIGKEVLDDPEGGLKSLLRRYPGYWGWKYWQSYEDELVNCKATQSAIQAARHARSAGVTGLAATEFEEVAAHLRRDYPGAGRWLGYSPAESLNRFFVRIRTLDIERALLVSAIALKRYELKHRGYPGSLSDLIPEFMSECPRDPIDGKCLRYRRNPDGTYLLYSIGENGVDDGGDPEPLLEASRQWWRARDAVWPWPATPEQVQAELSRARAEFQKQAASRASGVSAMSEAFRRRYGLVLPQSAKTNSSSKP